MALILIFLSIALTPFSQAQDFELSDVIRYYSQLPGNYIKPALASQSGTVQFDRFSDGTLIPKGKLAFDHEYTQDLFQLDVPQFIQSLGGIDLLEAKEHFYSRLRFFRKAQRHERPYDYLNGWLSLCHPPIKKLDTSIAHYVHHFSPEHPRPEQSQYFNPRFQLNLDHQTHTELTFGNHLQALFNGDAIREKTRLVKDAHRYILGSVMAIACDGSSKEFIDALISKAQSGVQVKLMMEHFYGNLVFKPCANRLRAGGVDIILVNDKLRRDSFLSFFHTKFWVRDGEEAIVGGQNIVKYQNTSTGYNQMNRDTDLLIRGPGATDFTWEFIKIWEAHSRYPNGSLQALHAEILNKKDDERLRHLRGRDVYTEKLLNPKLRMKGTCRVLVQEAYNRNLSIADTLRAHMSAARQSMILTSPEVSYHIKKSHQSPVDLFFLEIKSAAKRGVETEFLTNGVDGGNGELTAAYRTSMEQAFQSGRKLRYLFLHKILSFEPQTIARKHRHYLEDLKQSAHLRAWSHFNYVHAKQGYFDRIATSISSMNFDKPSIERNFEAGAICMDEHLSDQMESQLTLDLSNSIPVTSRNENH